MQEGRDSLRGEALEGGRGGKERQKKTDQKREERQTDEQTDHSPI